MEKLVVPRLKVHRDWYQGLAADFIDHSHPDVGGAPDAQEAANAEVTAWLMAVPYNVYQTSSQCPTHPCSIF